MFNLFATSGCAKGVQHQTTLRDPSGEVQQVHRATQGTKAKRASLIPQKTAIRFLEMPRDI